MKKQPEFFKEFITENSSKEKDGLKERVRENNLEFIKKRKEKQEELQSLETSITTGENAKIEAIAHCERLENELKELSSGNFLKKIASYLKIRNLQTELQEIEDIADEKERALKTDNYKKDYLTKEVDLKETPYELKRAKEMVEDFYVEQKRNWTQSDYSPEDIREYFSEEHLSSLSLEDYTLLLRRFPKHMVTHVTRQGIRDHVGHMYHTGGEGEYMDSFCKIVEDGKMRSPLGVHLVEQEKEKAIAKFLRLDLYDTKDEALSVLKNKTEPEKQREPGSYADSSSIHFATDFVADEFYGSERGNEIFFCYPSAFIASQHHFSGQLNDGSQSTNWNDQWVWANNEEKGISIDAGIVFIPKNTPVSSENGSRYQLDENLEPLKNSSYINKIKNLVYNEKFKELTSQLQDALCDLRGKEGDHDYAQKNTEQLAKIEEIKNILNDEFDISEEKLLQSLFSFHHLGNLQIRIKHLEELKKHPEQKKRLELEEEDLIRSIEEMLKTNGNLYIEAEDTISTEEYWEKYFEKAPHSKPSKIVYYEESDPTDALLAWQERNGISERSTKHDLGIEGSNVERNSTQATDGMKRFESLATKVIENHFANKKK